MGRAKGGTAAVALAMPGRRRGHAPSPSPSAPAETLRPLVIDALPAAGLDAAADAAARAELKRRFGEYVDFHTTEQLHEHLELLVEALSDEGYDLGSTRDERARFRAMLQDMQEVNSEVERITGLEDPPQDSDKSLRDRVDQIVHQAQHVREQVPSRQEFMDMTWTQPLQQMRAASQARAAGELSPWQFARAIQHEIGRGTIRTVQTLWRSTGAVRGFSSAVKMGVVAATVTGITPDVGAEAATKFGLAAAAVTLIGAGVWAQANRWRKNRKNLAQPESQRDN